MNYYIPFSPTAQGENAFFKAKGGIFMNMNPTPQQQQALINAASQKLGISPEQIAAMLQSGKAEELAARAGVPVQQYANNPAAIERLLSDPAARAVIKKLMGGG